MESSPLAPRPTVEQHIHPASGIGPIANGSAQRAPARLLAVDLDGTLVNREGALDPRDVDAIKSALRDGVVVTIATGRLSSNALWIARHLGVVAPIICADGAALVCAETGETLEETAIASSIVDAVVDALSARSLSPFLFFHHGAHGDALGKDFTTYVTSWTSHLTVHARLRDAPVLRGKAGVLVALGMGDRANVELARAAIEVAHGDSLDVAAFSLSGADWALRAQRRGLSKGACLERLCARLGIERAHVAAVGDWYNDVPMFAWAGRSFAMGQAPDVVRAAATDVLSATAATGGGVAEALARWL
jgi:Cof subfamily protein (haloacid dehalogenase superfamily)